MSSEHLPDRDEGMGAAGPKSKTRKKTPTTIH